jgi:MFS family permease
VSLSTPTEDGLLAAPALRRVVAVLSITEIVSWGVLFYAFPVLLTTISHDTGWPTTWLAAAFTLGQLVAAAAGVWVGRHIDAVGPRTVMSVGSALGVSACVALAATPDIVTWFAAWVLAGFAMSATLYAPAFTAITHWARERRVQALTTVTLVAGFASTVFAPLTAVLADRFGWRPTYLILAAILSTTIPLHWWGLHAPWPSPVHHLPRPTGTRRARHFPVGFGRLLLALTLAAFALSAVVINFVPLQLEHGISTTAAAAALGVGGAGQVAGRLLYGPMLVKLDVRVRTVVTLAAASVTILLLALIHEPLAVIVAVSFAAGTARGVFTLLQATAVSERWGTAGYGWRTAVITGCTATAAALSPWIGNLIASWTGSYGRAFVLFAILSAFGGALIALTSEAPSEDHAW